MEAYKERLKTEFNELRDRIVKLATYIKKIEKSGSEQYEGQKQLLTRQYYVMRDYIIVLERRAEKEDIDLD